MPFTLGRPCCIQQIITVQTSLKQLNPVEYELEIDATAQELAPKINKRLREHQASITLKGFRPGKVPVSLLKKMYGESLLVFDVIEKSVMGVFADEVVEKGDYDVIGMPTLSQLDYKIDGDLHAVMKFGIKPEIELQDLSGESLLKLVHEISDEEIDQEIENMLKKEAELKSREEGGIEDTDHVVLDMQQLDSSTATPIVGKREEDVAFFLDDEKLKADLKSALLGKSEGESFRVNLPLEEKDERDPDAPSSELLILPGDATDKDAPFETYEVTVKEVKERMLPELDEEFIKGITKEEAEDEEGLRKFILGQLENMWEGESRRLLEGELVSKMLELHTFQVPGSALEVYLNSFVSELKQQAGDALPVGFDEESYKESRKPEAEKLARWQLIREHIVDEKSLEVTDEDRDAYFIKMGGSEEMANMLKNYYAQMGNNMLERVDHELLNTKVVDILAEQFTIKEMDKQEFTDTLKERAEARNALEI